MTDARRILARAQRETLERSMLQQLTHYLQFPGLTWVQQYQFASVDFGLKYRADFAELNWRLLIEIQGGTRINGAHNRGGGYERDCYRLAIAQILGFDMLYVTVDMLQDNRALHLVERWFLAQAQRRRAA